MDRLASATASSDQLADQSEATHWLPTPAELDAVEPDSIELVEVTGPATPAQAAEHGPFRRLRGTVSEVRARTISADGSAGSCPLARRPDRARRNSPPHTTHLGVAQGVDAVVELLTKLSYLIESAPVARGTGP